ncbi:single-stranded DNA-binding protein [Mucilaginibacter sp. AK015]|uniref:single-stranded DNA-binding protein n=1 Tax=Mucilaginibacter sp. AK015 TaxID=2723072 RepID=UPI00160A7C0C|nr:single-stranded DNA-binding protein [Mucilaginibacter sp. AK015]
MFQNSGINKVILLGVIANKPAWRIMEKQKWLCFQLVTDEVFYRQNISQQHAEYHSIRVVESLAGIEIDNLKEGAEVYLEGKVTTQASIDQLGIKRYDTFIVAGRLNIMKLPEKGEMPQHSYRSEFY